MTPEEFDNSKFYLDTKIIYKNKEYELAGVDFEERLIGIQELPNKSIVWKRCENVEMLKK